MEILNKKIMEQETLILDKTIELSKLKKQLDIYTLETNNALEAAYNEDKTNKTLSNAEKRLAIVSNGDIYKDLASQITKLEYEIKVLEIENRYNLREFNILLEAKK